VRYVFWGRNNGITVSVIKTLAMARVFLMQQIVNEKV